MGKIEARVTVNLKGASVGDKVTVDPSDPYMKACIAQGVLVPTGGPVVEDGAEADPAEARAELDDQPDESPVEL